MFEDDAYADRSFRTEAERAGLEGRDRAFAMRLAYGTIQQRLTLDHLIGQFTGREIADLDPPVVAALRIGIYQIAFMERVPDHAAVGESVELTRLARSRGHGFVNATLRRATREARDAVAKLGDETAAQASLKYSHPLWIAELWWEALGPEPARALMAADNEPAESAARANTLVTDADALIAELPVAARRDPLVEEAIVFEQPFDVHGSRQFEQGLLMPQSRAAMLVSRTLDPQPGERVLDLCAAPGAKTTHVAALMRNEGELIAVERNPDRAKSITENCERLGVTCATVEVGDAAEPREPSSFDRVLADPPCSDLGTLQSRPDVRWRKQPQQIDELRAIQQRVLEAGFAALKPGGRLVYSTCTISPEENERQIERFLEREPSAQPDDLAAADGRRFLQTLPSRDATDGFFIAALRKQD